MKLLLNVTWVLAGVALLLMVLHTKITIKPFSISFENWRFVLGILLIFVGIELLCYDAVVKYRKNLLEQLEQCQREKLK